MFSQLEYLTILHLKEKSDNMGLFGKSNRTLLEWQKLIAPSASKLVLSEQQLKSKTFAQANRHIEIAKDCSELINTTCKPETYFSRYELLIEELELLCKYEKYIKFTGLSPHVNLKNVQNTKRDSINAFIDRYWESVYKKITTLKTDKAKINQYNKFIESMKKYDKQMMKANIDYYLSKRL